MEDKQHSKQHNDITSEDVTITMHFCYRGTVKETTVIELQTVRYTVPSGF